MIQRVDSRGDHLGRELRLLFGEGGAEGVALGDPVSLHRPKHRNKNDSTVNNYQDTVGVILCSDMTLRSETQTIHSWFNQSSRP